MSNYEMPVRIHSMMLNLTDACNMACKYCFVNQHPHYMTLQIAKDAVDFFMRIDRTGVKRLPSINYFGGEPLLMWDSIIVPLTKYIKEEKHYEVTLGMTSNCLLLTQDKVDFLKKYNINLLFSIDGDKATQDYNRPCHDSSRSSFDILEPKLQMISDNFKTTFRSTLIPETCNNLFHNIMFAKSKGFHTYFAVPDCWSKWTPENIENLESNLCQYTLYFIDAYRRTELPKDFITFTPLTKALRDLEKIEENRKKNEIHRSNWNMCGLGTNGFAVNYEGAIFGCQETPSKGYDNNLHYIGDIYNGIDRDRQDKLLKDFREKEVICEKPELCEDCPNRFYCGDKYCHTNSYLIHNNSCIKPEINCRWDIFLTKLAYFVKEVLSDGNTDSVFYDQYLRKEENK